MAAFVRRFIPGRSGAGPKLPELKWWANVVFALYILITIPLLAFLFFMVVKGFPRIIATAWDSAMQQKDLLAASAGSGDVLGVATGTVNLLTLALPTLGAALAMSTTVRRVFGALWRWSAGSGPKRTGTLMASAAALVGLVLLWLPDLPFAPGTSGPLYEQARFEPIQRDERLTVAEMGVPVVSRIAPPPAPARMPTAEPTDEPAPAAALGTTPTPEGTVAGTPTLGTTPARQPTSGATGTAVRATATSGGTTATPPPGTGTPATSVRTTATPPPGTGAPATPVRATPARSTPGAPASTPQATPGVR
jgi:hypothetical protein